MRLFQCYPGVVSFKREYKMSSDSSGVFHYALPSSSSSSSNESDKQIKWKKKKVKQDKVVVKNQMYV